VVAWSLPGWAKRLTLLFGALLAAACATTQVASTPPEPARLDAIAREFVSLTLEIGERDEGYVDAYYGPPEWREAAQANPRNLAQLAAAAERLHGRLLTMDPAGLDFVAQRRREFLAKQVVAARTRLRMLQGENLNFADEASGLYAVTPLLKPLSELDPILARIDRLVPGSGSLSERVQAFQDRFTVPRDRLDAVMRAAIDECRRRTLQHIALPEGERFALEFVTGQSWSAYNWYQGDYRSLIQVNTGLPVRISRAIDLGCHEGYPGHHAYNALLEQKLARGRGWVEYMVYPLYSPQSLIAEGSANYGVELAFPGSERLAFETRVLYPLAGLPIAQAAEYAALEEAIEALGAARFTIAREYLDRRIGREEAIALLQRYQLVSRARAEQSLAFIDHYRAYVLNYGLGRDMVREHVEAQGSDPAARWRAMERILSEPTTPSDLTPFPR
jgi:hypothetical protein